MDEFQSPTGIEWRGDIGMVQYGNDRSMVCLFYNKAVHNPGKSQIEGRPIYENKIFVRIHPPGERFNIVDRPANDNDKRRFATQWHQFMQQQEQVPEGTPIELLYPNLPAAPAMLRANGVQTIEQCAELSGTAIDTIGMGAQRHVTEARKYLELANKGVGASKFRQELEERDGEIRVLKQKVEQLMEEVSRQRANNGGNALAQMQEMLAAMSGKIPPAGTVRSDKFDAATAQINANSGRAGDKAGKPRRTRVQP